jgi:predicted transcriptional regulator
VGAEAHPESVAMMASATAAKAVLARRNFWIILRPLKELILRDRLNFLHFVEHASEVTLQVVELPKLRPPFLSRGNGETLTRARGQLEAELMHFLWNVDRPLTARQVQQLFNVDVPALTTVITVLDRMAAKGRLTRAAESGKAATYQPVQSRVEQATRSLTEALAMSADRQTALMHLAGSLTPEDLKLLRDALDNSD